MGNKKLTLEERIEKDAREYTHDSPQIIFEFRGYANGAKDYYKKGWDEAINRVIDKLTYSPGGLTLDTKNKIEEIKWEIKN